MELITKLSGLLKAITHTIRVSCCPYYYFIQLFKSITIRSQRMLSFY